MGRRIILVRDSLEQRVRSRDILKHAGFLVSEVTSAGEALELSTRDVPLAVVVESFGQPPSVPAIRSGLSQHAIGEEIPILVLSDQPGRKSEDENVDGFAIASRTVAYLPGPISAYTLLRELAYLTRPRGSAHRAADEDPDSQFPVRHARPVERPWPRDEDVAGSTDLASALFSCLEPMTSS